MKLELGKVLILVLLLFAAGTAEARIYKWVDTNGEIHYSETAPVGQKKTEVQTQITTPSAGSAPDNPADQFILQQEMDGLRRKADADARQQAAVERAEAAKKAKCANAKQELSIYQRAIPIAVISAQGSKSYLSDSERTRKISNAQQEITENCN